MCEFELYAMELLKVRKEARDLSVIAMTGGGGTGQGEVGV